MTAGATVSTTGAPDVWGGTTAQPVDHTGVNPYVPGTGDVLSAADFGCHNNLLWVGGGVSVSGTYFCLARASGTGYATWHLMWFVSSSGAEAGALDLSGETVKLLGIGI